MVKRKVKDYHLIENNEMIYSSVPEYMGLKTDTQRVLFIKKDIVKEYFKDNVGRKNAKPLNTIAKELNFSNKGNSLQFRHIVAKLVEENKIPIVSCGDGYYMADEKKDIIQNIETEKARIKGIQRRINALQFILNDNKEIKKKENNLDGWI